MADNVDRYLEEVVNLGDEGSQLLAKICSPTLKNSEYVDVIDEGMNGIAVLRFPKGTYVIVHSAGGDTKQKDLASHTKSLVDRLVKEACSYNARPVAFADVIDSRTGDKTMIKTVGNALVKAANAHGLAILNGENAILGSRVNCEANVSGTMISMTKDTTTRRGCAIFDPEGKAVFINADGVGTKTEFYERTKDYISAVRDFFAMNIDDASKLGAVPRVISGVVETKGRIPFDDIKNEAYSLAENLGFSGIMRHENVGNRLKGYNDKVPSYNISGSVVSTIDEERLKNPLKPKAGDDVIAMKGEPNPRSNGITGKRETMVDLFGPDYHKTKEGKLFLEFLAEPSTILYPVFNALMTKDLVTSIYHMSGGAYDGKLAKPLAKHGLFVRLENLFPPDWRELTLAGASFTSAETAYAKWPMGNDGFVTTKYPDETIKMIQECGLEARKVGKLECGKRTGVELVASNGEKVYYPGK